MVRSKVTPKNVFLRREISEAEKISQQQEYKRIVSDLLEQSTSKEASLTHDEKDEETFAEYVDASTPLHSPHRVTTPSKVFYYDSTLMEVEDLQAKVRDLLRENAFLKKENQKQKTEIASLQEESELQQKKHAWDMESLQKSLLEVKMDLKNIEDKLAKIFTDGQISKMKKAMKRQTWTEEDIAQSITLYAASPKAYRLLYKQDFPLPGVRTLQR
ncbi:PREDICTED: uncharacterized protein LOC108365818 [Rhagoletis zephyria]|uniref:uncharacterized protein LOC108365818 n=1 Tax=Rhagoletis zephyria TaxID=28612 RepID=UPI0008114334|nr:PREDICTED: uncharacterized protein LOC108365818 [Rhagoletis zephyria]